MKTINKSQKRKSKQKNFDFSFEILRRMLKDFDEVFQRNRRKVKKW